MTIDGTRWGRPEDGITFDQMFELMRGKAGALDFLASKDLSEWDQSHMIFRAVDKDGTGSISMAELAMLLRQYGLPHSDVAMAMEKFDKDHSGSVSTQEFYENFRVLWKFAFQEMQAKVRELQSLEKREILLAHILAKRNSKHHSHRGWSIRKGLSRMLTGLPAKEEEEEDRDQLFMTFQRKSKKQHSLRSLRRSNAQGGVDKVFQSFRGMPDRTSFPDRHHKSSEVAKHNNGKQLLVLPSKPALDTTQTNGNGDGNSDGYSDGNSDGDSSGTDAGVAGAVPVQSALDKEPSVQRNGGTQTRGDLAGFEGSWV